MAGGRVRLGPEADCGRSAQEFHDDAGPCAAVTTSILLGHLVSYPASGIHGRTGLLYRRTRVALPEDRGSHLFPGLRLLDQNLRGFVWPWRGVRHCHAVSVWHQLEPLLS